MLTTLPQRGDLLVLDALVHASIHEGRAGRPGRIPLQRPQRSAIGRGHHSRLAREGGTGRVWIVVESVYSMDGDIAPLDDLIAIADRHDAFLMVDEAHGTGVYGEQGAGSTAPHEGRDNLVIVHTCGKALGAAGALVTAPTVLRDFMVNRCRPFIFATAPSPLTAVAVREALLILQQEPERQQRLASAGRVHASRARARGWRSPIALADRALYRRRQCARDAALLPHCRRAASISRASGRRPCRRAPRGCGLR